MNITRLCFLLFTVSNIIIKSLILFFARKHVTIFSLNSCTISRNPSKYKVFFRNGEIKHSHAADKIERALQSYGYDVCPFSLKTGH